MPGPYDSYGKNVNRVSRYDVFSSHTGLSQAVHQVLKHGGRFAIIDWYRRPREETTVLDQPRGPSTELRMEPEDVQQVVEPAGFKLEQVVDVGPYHYGAVFIKN